MKSELKQMRTLLGEIETEIPETDEALDACEMIRDGLERLQQIEAPGQVDE